MIEMINPNGTTETYQYDPVFHNVTEETDEDGNETDYTYNSFGEMLSMSVTGPNSPMPDVTTYTWANGLMQTTTDPDGNLTVYTYNGLRQETAEQDYDAASNLIGDTSYTYDANGFIASMTVGATGPEPEIDHVRQRRPGTGAVHDRPETGTPAAAATTPTAT